MTTTKVHAITFEINTQLYGIDATSVQEIIPILKIKTIPQGPAFVEGIINLRGSIIPVIDLRKMLGATGVAFTLNTRIIISHIHTHSIGFIIEDIDDVREFLASQVSSLSTHQHYKLIESVVTLDSGKMVEMVTLEHALTANELEQIFQTPWNQHI